MPALDVIAPWPAIIVESTLCMLQREWFDAKYASKRAQCRLEDIGKGILGRD
jgi:hypothetical protein